MKRTNGYIVTIAFALIVFAISTRIATSTYSVEYYNAPLEEIVIPVEVAKDVATTSPQAYKLAEYLRAKGAYDLSKYADEIVKLPRWVEALAITAKETSFCRAGVGSSRNNCGAIRSSIAGRGFKIYETKYDSVWDVSYLIAVKPRYKDKSIAEMNGLYCVNELAGGGPCPNWTESITSVMAEIERAVK